MARIIKTTPKNQKRLLLKAGLSIFLFLQIQMPNAAEVSIKKLNHWSFELCRQAKNTCCMKANNTTGHLAMARPLVK
ncbi:hypothetical protein I5M27_14615 [Adhaeribacter sp. BT258]|uniref:Secreted protein n=1 Tax=Adhaeribacter terrigena TaxID=2793070 RepID=A0ABS1C4W1_9BACT|nr:hypothetical protein [Adhaeribacter terrigena]MBK0404226.1 hypothetical protein [Adhaeribacter terrigena]